MTNQTNRRRFPRLEVFEEARVYDEDGRELGTVAQVSGNGMNIDAASLPLAQSLASGHRMRITVVEPGSRATTVLDVVVRQRDGSKVGMEFLDSVG